MQNTQLDQDAVNLAKAIRQVESQNNPNARGTSGEVGYYQFMPETWASSSKKYLGRDVPLEQATREEQNEVAYKQIKEWKDAGYNPGQIASMWNAGAGEPEAYIGTFSNGAPSKTEKFDVPGYTQKVYNTYNSLKGATFQTQPYIPTQKTTQISQVDAPTENTIGSQLKGRLQDVSESVGKVAEGKVGSGLLQTAGAIAGGIGDVAGALVGVIPGVKQIEGLIGKGVSKAAETQIGKDLIQNYTAFAQENPEAAKNIGSIVNIASVIPMVQGARLALQTAKTATAQAFKGSIEQAAENEIRQTLKRTVTGNKVLTRVEKRGINPIQTLFKNDALPDVIPDNRGIGRYSTQSANDVLDSKLDILETELQSKLQSIPAQQLAGYVPLDTLRKESLDTVKKVFAEAGESKTAMRQVNKIFDDYASTQGDLVPLAQLNTLKRSIRKKVNFDASDADKLNADVRYQIGQVFMKNIEDVAEKRGIQGVKELNTQMGELLESQKVLNYLNNRSVYENPGLRTLLGRKGGDVSTIAGEAIGQSFGFPGVGAALGRGISNRATAGGKTSLQKLTELRMPKAPIRLGKTGLVVPTLQAGIQESKTNKSTQK